MYIDPYAKPKFYSSTGFYSTIKERTQEEAKKLWEKLVTEPWKAEDYPEVAQWVKEYSPVLDLFGVAVRKPNYVCWHSRPEKGCFNILLPDVQANRDFARSLRVRITERLGRGDVDGAWYDTMSLFYLAEHFKNAPFVVTNLVGVAVEKQGIEAAMVILKHGHPMKEQLEHFANDLPSFPRKKMPNVRMDCLVAYDLLHWLPQMDHQTLKSVLGKDDVTFKFRMLLLLPFDLNISGRQITRFYRSDIPDNGLVTKEVEKTRTLFSMLFVRTRSNWIGDYVCSVLAMPNLDVASNPMNDLNARFEILRIAVALERYNNETKKYPENLEELVPQFLEEVPLDPFTKRKTLTYKIKPEEGTPYLVYSYGPNGKDDGGKTNPDDWLGSDVVFQR